MAMLLLFYCSEMWTVTKRDQDRIQTMKIKFFPAVMGQSFLDKREARILEKNWRILM
jgi:hypothetical protein